VVRGETVNVPKRFRFFGGSLDMQIIEVPSEVEFYKHTYNPNPLEVEANLSTAVSVAVAEEVYYRRKFLRVGDGKYYWCFVHRNEESRVFAELDEIFGPAV
jgi:hypothetical protein